MNRLILKQSFPKKNLIRMLLPTLSGYLTGIAIVSVTGIFESGIFDLEIAKNMWLAVMVAPLCEMVVRAIFNPIIAKLTIIGTSLICFLVWLASVPEKLGGGVLSILRNQNTGVFAFGAFLILLITLIDGLIMSKHSEKMFIFCFFYVLLKDGFDYFINGFVDSRISVFMGVGMFVLFFAIVWSVIIDFGVMLWRKPIG